MLQLIKGFRIIPVARLFANVDSIKMYRDKHPPLPNDAETLRKAISYRCRTSGQRELELLLQSFFNAHCMKMNLQELQAFHEEVLMLDNPVIIDYLIGKMHSKGKYINMLVEYSKSTQAITEESIFK